MKTTYFRHTFICCECENYNYRVTAHPDPCVSYVHIDCGSCLKRIPMNTHHATNVCLEPVFDVDLICASIIYAALIQAGIFKNMGDAFEKAILAVKKLKEQENDSN